MFFNHKNRYNVDLEFIFLSLLCVRLECDFSYSKDCVDCRRFQAKWEAVAAHFQHRINVARINLIDGGQLTARRFQIDHAPSIIL